MHRTLLALMGLLALGVGAASAQVTAPLTFTTGRTFYVGNRLLPAGTYIISHSTTGMNLLELRGPSHASLFFTSMQKANTAKPTASEVVFNKYGGDGLYLSSIVVENQDNAMVPLQAGPENKREPLQPTAKVEIPATLLANRR